MLAPATTPHTWPINTGLTLTFEGDSLWVSEDGTPVTTGTLVLTVREPGTASADGNVIGTYNGLHTGNPDGRWRISVDALASLVPGRFYDFHLVGTPTAGQPRTVRWWAIAGYQAPTWRIAP